MAKLTAFMLCDSISAIPVPEGGVLQQLVSPQIALRPQFIPGNFSFGVAVGVQGVNLHITNRIRFLTLKEMLFKTLEYQSFPLSRRTHQKQCLRNIKDF